MIERFNCPSCSQTMELDSEQFGQSVQCPLCGVESIAERPQKKNVASQPPATAPARPRKMPASKLCECEACGESISYGAIFCPKCGDLKNTWSVAWRIVGVFGSMQVIWLVIGLILAGIGWLIAKTYGL